MKNVIAKALVIALTATVISAITPNIASASNITAYDTSDNSIADPAINMTGYIGSNVRILTSEDEQKYEKSKAASNSKAKKRSRRAIRKAPSQKIDWDSYSSKYFYDKMNSNEQTLYDSLSDTAKEFMDNTTTAQSIDAYFPLSVMTALSVDEIKSTYSIWKETEAQYFFVANIGSSCGFDPKTGKYAFHIPVMTEYQDGGKRQTAREKFINTINSITSKASFGKTNIEKEKIVHDELVSRLTWDDNNDDDKQSSSSSLIEYNTVCAGYAAAFSVIMNGLNIPTISITSDTHEWNETCINNDNVWYNVDVTWDDAGDKYNAVPDGTNLRHKYFNVSDATLTDGNTAHTPEDIWSSRPVCSKDDTTYKELSFAKNSQGNEINCVSIFGTYGDQLTSEMITKNKMPRFSALKVYCGNQLISGSWEFGKSNLGKKIDSSLQKTDKGDKKYLFVKFIPDENPEVYKSLSGYVYIERIDKRPISVTINPITWYKGSKQPELTWTLDDNTTLGYQDKKSDTGISLSTKATASSDPGEYPIMGTYTSSNYNVTFKNTGVITVVQKTLKPVQISEDPSIRLTYGQKLSDSAINGGKASTEGTFSLADDADTSSYLTAGKHTVNIMFRPASSDYETVTKEITFTVNPKKIAATIKTPDPITEGDAIPETFEFTVDDNALVSPDTKADLKMTFMTEKKSGSRDYTITGAANNPNYEVTVEPATLTINAKPDVTPVLTIPDRSVTYGDALTDALLDKASATYDGASVPGTFSFTKSYGTLTAGTHALDVKFTPNGSGYTEAAGKLKLTVNKKPITITITDATMTAGDNTPVFSFKADNKNFVNGDTKLAIKVDYSLDGDTAKSGTYTITGTATADNYNVTVNPGKLTVNPKAKVNPTIAKKPSLSFTYGDTLAGKTLSGTATYGNTPVAGTFRFANDVNTSEILTARKHTVDAVFTPSDKDTYNSVKTTVEVTVAKRQIAVVIDDKTKTEGEADPSFTKKVTGSFVGTDNIDDFLTVSRVAGKTAGAYAIKGTVHDADNYDIKVTNGTLTIKAKPVEKPKDVTISSDPKVTVTYGDKLSTAAVTEGTAVYNDTAVAGTWKITTPDKTINKSNATQKVTVTFTPDDTKKYNSTTVQVTPDILKRKITVRADNITRTVGEKKSLTFKITDGSLISGDSESDLAVTLTSSNTSDTAGDYTISGNSASQYYDVTVELGTLTIKSKEKVTPAISTKPSIKITYGEKISNDKITKGAARDGSRTVKGTFTIAENVDTDKLLTAGTHTVKAVFTPDDKSAYNTVETEITVTVAKKHISITIDDKTKTEDEADPTFTKKVTGDFVGNDNIDDFLTISRRAGEAAGKYAITGTVKNADNYDITVTDGVLTINAKPEEKPAAATVQTAPVLTVTYGDRLSSASITNGSVISDGNAVTGTWKITTSDRVVNKSNASRKVTLTFTPSDTKKYSSVSVDVTPTVEKRKITVKADDITRTVGESKSLTYKISNGSLVSGDTDSDLKISLRASNTSDTAGAYMISGTSDSDYYEVTIQNGTLTVNAKSDSGSTSDGSTGSNTSGSQTGGNSGNTSGGSGSGSGSSSSDNPSNPSGTTVTTYSITYDLNGGTATGNPSSYRNDSNPITLTTPARTGYTFTGWTGSNGNTPQTTVTIRKGTTGNLYFVANWQDNNSANNSNTPADTGTYKISYNLNGGTVNRSNPVSYTVNDTYLINNPWREGYFFAGWTSNLSSVPQMVVTIPRGTTGDITFTATWTVDTSNHATADSDDNTNANTQTDDDGWTEWINGNDDSDIPDIPSTSITKTSSNKKSVTMKFKKTSITGYTVKYQVAIKKANTGGWKKSFVSKTSKTFKGLKKKTTYWVSVRPYITVDGTRYFGDWAKTKIRKTR